MDTVIVVLEDMFEIQVAGLTVAEVIEELLDVSLAVEEDCLHLAVSTPRLPTGNQVLFTPQHFD